MKTGKKDLDEKIFWQNRTIRSGSPWVTVMAIHVGLIYLIWLALFISKWFPYGVLQRTIDWHYNYF
jgi:hypothetical protein